MGGRGSYSATSAGRGRISVTRIGRVNVDHTPESRGDVRTLFRNVGIESVEGTNNFDTAVIGAFALQLGNLERKYGVIGDSENVVLQTMTNGNAKGAVSYYPHNPTNMTLMLNSAHLGSVGKINATLKSEQASGFKVKTNGSILSQARYTVTHEYGHMLENVLYQRAKNQGYKGSQASFNGTVRNEICSLAAKYGAKGSSPSRYGGTNSSEFFAESFASANLGNPSPYGKGMRDWLKQQGY